jgi:hypothetical protein
LKNFATLTRMRIQLTLRNKMFLFFSVIMPFGFFFLYSGVFAKGIPLLVRYFLGPVMALTVMGSFWGLSAALVTFREQGILRRFHVTPVTASDMLASNNSRRTPVRTFLFSRSRIRKSILRVYPDRRRHHVFCFPGTGGRQRDQHHAGNPGHQSAHMVSFDFSFRGHRAARKSSAGRQTRGAVPSCHISGHGTSGRGVLVCFSMQQRLFARYRFADGLGHPYVLLVRATLPLGARRKNSSQSQATRFGDGHSFCPAGDLAKSLEPHYGEGASDV